ncbi:MAG: methylated-DNA--[protein]-cysteine S-methyltransferase [Planctomycetota bacterium]
MSLDPSQYKTRVSYAWAHTEIGRVLVAATWKGVCFTSLGSEGALERLREWVARHEPGASLLEDRRGLRPVLQQIAAYARGERKRFDVHLDLRGTAFQRAVWDADRKIPYGQTRTYGDVARAIGRPSAARGVGGANGKNPVPLFVPCHRIVAKDGIGGFTGGLRHKRKLLELEGAREFV